MYFIGLIYDFNDCFFLRYGNKEWITEIKLLLHVFHLKAVWNVILIPLFNILVRFGCFYVCKRCYLFHRAWKYGKSFFFTNLNDSFKIGNGICWFSFTFLVDNYHYQIKTKGIVWNIELAVSQNIAQNKIMFFKQISKHKISNNWIN